MQTNLFAVELMMARKKKRLTQEEACFQIGVADSATLSRWENGKDIPSMKIIEKIVDVYDDPLLGYLYLQQCTGIGRIVLPPIERRDLGNSVLLLQKEHTDINRVKDTMIEIACDGQIDSHEQEQWSMALKEISELASACMGLSFMQMKKPLQCGNIEKAYV